MDSTHETPSGGDDARSEVSTSSLLELRRRKVAMLARHPERREFSTDNFELREAPTGVLRFSGYASVTDTPYDVGFFTETIKRGAFKRTLAQNPDVQLLINHGEGGSGMPIARTGKNMTLVEDERGLRVEAELDPEDPDVVLLARKMKRGLIDQMSFAFQVPEGEQEWNDEMTQRTIRSVNIHRGDVSVVNQGANGASMATMRSREASQALERIGPEGVMSMIVEVGGFCAMTGEQRAGKKISSTSMETLSHCLSLAARGDDAMDELQAVLSDYLGVANPDTDVQRAAEEPETPEEPKVYGLSSAERQRLYLKRQRQQIEARAALRRIK